MGIHSNEEILKNKGPPVMQESERYEMLTHIKWVDEIAYDVPYSPSIEILDKYHCEKAFHGYATASYWNIYIQLQLCMKWTKAIVLIEVSYCYRSHSVLTHPYIHVCMCNVAMTCP